MLTFTNPVRRSPPAAPPKPEKLDLPVDLRRLCDAVRYDRMAMGAFRKKMQYAVRQMAGFDYGDNGAKQEMPLNLLSLWVDVLLGATCANNPRLMVSVADQRQATAAEIMQGWINKEIVRMDAASIFRRTIQDALFWQGILSVSIADTDDAAESGWGLKAGQPFMRSISPNDYVCDQQSDMHERCAYQGHQYRIPVALANEIHRTSRMEKFEESDQTDLNFGGDEKITAIGGPSGQREEIEPHTTIWELFSPKHKQIWLLRDSGGLPDETKEPIAVKRWIGVPRGPFHRLSLGDVNGNLNPNGPANHLGTQNENLNSAWRKLMRQTRDYKKVIPFRGVATDDAKRMQKAKDGELFMCEDPAALAELEVGGAGNAVWTMAQAMQEAFNFMGGNLGLLSGRAAQSKTATQDKMLNENATASIGTIQDRTQTFIEGSFRSYAWLCWNHPAKVMKSEWESPSFPELKVKRRLGPWDSEERGLQVDAKRTGPMPDFRLDVYSLARKTPETRMQFMTMVVDKMLPMLQAAQQQGVTINFNELIAMWSQMGDEPGLKKIFTYAEPIPQDAGSAQQGGGMGKPAETTRRYERYSSGGDGPQQKGSEIDTQMAQLQPGKMNPNSGAG